MIKNLLPLFLLTCFFGCFADSLTEKAIVIVTPSYNNVKWYEANLKSIINQDYNNYRMIYMDDCSKDGTADAVEAYLKSNLVDYCSITFDDSIYTTITEATEAFRALVNSEPHHFILVRNVNRTGALANLYRAIHSCEDQEIVATVDGDDWLPDPRVLQRLNKTYEGEVWYSHGCLIEYPWGNVTWSEPVPNALIAKNEFRKYKCPSHLRTFYSWIFKKIQLEDFLYNEKFYPMAWDMAIMYPIAEMAGFRSAYVSEVNYVYNMSNQLNDNKVDPKLQNDLDYIIRHKEPYKRLE